MAYGDCKDLARRTAADKAFNIAKEPKCDGYQRGLAPRFINFLVKRLLVVVLNLCLKMST